MIQLAESLGADKVGENIQATLVVPKNYCGDYNLVVREYQNAYNSFYNFQYVFIKDLAL